MGNAIFEFLLDLLGLSDSDWTNCLRTRYRREESLVISNSSLMGLKHRSSIELLEAQHLGKDEEYPTDNFFTTSY